MRKKLISALVLAAVACWNIPVVLAMPSALQRPIQQESKAQGDSCCPRFHVQLAAPLLAVIPPPEMPCGEQRPCCAKQGPQNPPALITTTRVERPKARTAPTNTAGEKPQFEPAGAQQGSAKKFLPSYFVRSTVLRI